MTVEGFQVLDSLPVAQERLKIFNSSFFARFPKCWTMRPKITSGPGALPRFVLAMAASSSSIENGIVKIFLWLYLLSLEWFSCRYAAVSCHLR
ncbi:hypothetical protein TNCV_4320421 [Trichonephila clavipes]|nr:hypothetical protein TNCV_4320421 [Trichonephila clavipes]